MMVPEPVQPTNSVNGLVEYNFKMRLNFMHRIELQSVDPKVYIMPLDHVITTMVY